MVLHIALSYCWHRTIGNKTHDAEVMKKDEAEKVYNETKADGKSAGLVETR